MQLKNLKRLRFRTKTLNKLFLLFIISTILFTAYIYGLIEIHYEKIFSSNKNDNDLAFKTRKKLFNQPYINDIDLKIKNEDKKRSLNTNGYNQSNDNHIDSAENKLIKGLFSVVDKVINSIKRQLNLYEINNIVNYKNRQNELKIKITEKIRKQKEMRKNNTANNNGADNVNADNTNDDDDDDIESDDFYFNIGKLLVKNSQNDNKKFDNEDDELKLVNRSVIVNYLKLEQHFLKMKRNALRTVKSVIRSKYDLEYVIFKIFDIIDCLLV